MKQELTSLDIYFLKKELRQKISGGLFRKVYQYKTTDKSYQFIFEINLGEKTWLYIDRNKVFLTSFKREAPKEPPSFCMFLRKHLINQKIRDVRQNKFDRILEIHTDDYVLIFELFSKGNVILCDSMYNIIMPLEFQKWKDRVITPKVKYKYPVAPVDPFELDFDQFKKTLQKTEKTIGAFLAVSFGFGEYANEICSITEIDNNKPAKDLDIEESLKIHKILEILKNADVNAFVYEDTVSPFQLKNKEGRKFQSFSEALDEFFSRKEILKVSQEQEDKIREEEERIERIRDQQRRTIEKFSTIKKKSRTIADKIYSNYGLIENIISGIRKAIDSGKSWKEIKQYIENEESQEAAAVKEIREGEGIVVITLEDEDIEIDFTQSLEKNAERYYEISKKAKEKQEAAEKSLEIKIEKAEIEEKPVYKEKKRWYEKYKWFISSSEFLVIAGKNATHNETIVKKYAESNDLLFHADIEGAAFVLIKSEGREIDDRTIREAAEFSAANSKAWARCMGTINVYSFKPEQATKPEGSLDKGSFVIIGERVWHRNLELKLSIGVKIDRELDKAKLVSGPVMSVRTHSDYFVTIKPGYKESLELAREIKNKIILKSKPEDRFLIDKIPLEEIQKLIPSGKGDIIEGVEI